MLFVCIIQIGWSISAIQYDFKRNYSCGEEVANFIKKYDYQKMDIYGTSYYDVVINPYFSKNIFKNWEQGYAFFYLDFQNRFYQTKIDEEFIEKEKPDIVINSTIAGLLEHNHYENEDYNKYYFKGATYMETGEYENQEIVVYVLKEKDKKKA